MSQHKLFIKLVWCVVCFAILSCPLLSAAENAGKYIIGPEDVIEIGIWRHPDLGVVTMVPQGGRIDLPLVGEMQAAGLTCDDLAAAINKAYSPDYIKDCRAMVIVRDYKSKKVYIYGQVPKPGTYYLRADTTLRQVIAEAGGIAQTGKAQEVVVTRKGARIASIDLNRLLMHGDSSQDLALEANDAIFVPFNSESAVYIIGQISRPGPVYFDDNEKSTLLNVIAKSGGPTERADLKHAVLIRRDGSTISLKLDELINRARTEFDMAVARGETILIPEELENQIYVLGDVRMPGLYTVRGRVTLTRAVSLAGGTTDTAALSKVRIIRRGEKTPQVQRIDFTKIVRSGDLSLDTELQPRDIVFIPKTRAGAVGAWFGQFQGALTAILGLEQAVVVTKYLSE